MMNPASTSAVSRDVKMFGAIPSARCNWPKRRTPEHTSRTTREFPRSPMNSTAAAPGLRFAGRWSAMMGRLVDTAELSVVPADDAPPTRAQDNNFGDIANGVGLALPAQEGAYVGLAHAVSYRRGIDDSLGL